jgi:hypothetical protein
MYSSAPFPLPRLDFSMMIIQSLLLDFQIIIGNKGERVRTFGTFYSRLCVQLRLRSGSDVDRRWYRCRSGRSGLSRQRRTRYLGFSNRKRLYRIGLMISSEPDNSTHGRILFWRSIFRRSDRLDGSYRCDERYLHDGGGDLDGGCFLSSGRVGIHLSRRSRDRFRSTPSSLGFLRRCHRLTISSSLVVASWASSQYPHPQAFALPHRQQVWRNSDDQQKWTLETSRVLLLFHEVYLYLLVLYLHLELVQ